MASNSVGKITQVMGAVVDVQFDGELPAILNALQAENQGKRGWCSKWRSIWAKTPCAPSPWIRPTAWSAASRRPIPARRSPCRSGRRRWAASSTSSASRSTSAAGQCQEAFPRSTGRRPNSSTSRPKPRSWSPASRSSTCWPLRQGRQDRPVRRRRRRQDRHHHGAHQQHRQGAWRRVGLRRRGRAHPRGQRPLSRDDRDRRHQGRRPGLQGGAGLWPDERAAGRARPRRPDRPDRAEYFRDEEGQDVLFFVDNIFRFTQAGSEVSALLGRIPSAVGYQPTLATDMGACRSASPRPRRARSPRCRRSTCRPTI